MLETGSLMVMRKLFLDGHYGKKGLQPVELILAAVIAASLPMPVPLTISGTDSGFIQFTS